MKKIMFQCIGNIILFILFGLTFIQPFSDINQTESGFSATTTIFPTLLIIYLILFPIAYLVLSKKYHWNKYDNSELTYADEREQAIVSASLLIAYKVLIGGLLVSIATIGGANMFSLATGMEISIYILSITLMTALLVITTISYGLTWCLEYSK